MYLMYVDESGDPGMSGSPTDYFALSGLVIHELSWRPVLERLVGFRRRMRDKFGLKMREEIHAAHFINNPGALKRIPRNDRLTILRHFAEEIASAHELSIINIILSKQEKHASFDVLEAAWQALLQRFENTMTHRNFPGPANADDRGIVLPDGQPSKIIRSLQRRMRHFNPIPSRFGGATRRIKLVKIVEDPVFRDSRDSLLVQAADLCCFLAYQSVAPNSYMRKKGAANWIDRLGPVLCLKASPRDARGIVRL
ncbi:MAG: DUF3800 domain-containing protein [Xanthomonadales bacterium]|nr:DUF3800 domain-containing protein [Xanthomonadales bacterium]MBK7144477.1 DUF3800 domain-containing protein [Xanthomonadales bacterium]MCC6560412.1 DUF3800 domain-containing protein [Xanthomonadales bacterium]